MVSRNTFPEPQTDSSLYPLFKDLCHFLNFLICNNNIFYSKCLINFC